VNGVEVIFWAAVFGIVYPYFGYPLLLLALRAIAGWPWLGGDRTELPSVSIIIPVHNEAVRVARKMANTAALAYPSERLQVLFVSDGSTDNTVELIRTAATPAMTVVELTRRGGKAAALNAGLARATNDIVVFSDASIQLEAHALERLVVPFADPKIGCVSGEDRIAEASGEGLYGRYELFLRRLESDVHSIVGASGSFYAQRRSICQPFVEGLAPDFLSVLRTVEQGYRAVSEPTAVGTMTSVSDPRHEFERKVRTLIRGLTTLFAHLHLLNPLKYGRFAFLLFSHKVMRWTAPIFLLAAMLSALLLAGSPLYLAAFLAQALFYLAALAALIHVGGIDRSLPGRVALYFSSSNAAVLMAWFQFARGVRQELWTPTRR
jgi:cellulose synthase/poly-beta-1,6-N-acetylglucosamine synthase-like glycosyltransferase